MIILHLHYLKKSFVYQLVTKFSLPWCKKISAWKRNGICIFFLNKFEQIGSD